MFATKQENSNIPMFWKTDPDSEYTSETKSSRYLNDFEELRLLGELYLTIYL